MDAYEVGRCRHFAMAKSDWSWAPGGKAMATVDGSAQW
jgi:hypothetical protein